MEQIPIMIDGQKCGVLRFRREGAYMVCRGHAQWQGEMLRLWVYGRGEPVYLGVLIPDGQDGGTVYKKFSLAEFARMPAPVSYCGTQQDDVPQQSNAPRETDILWYAQGDGTLIHDDGQHRYIALPADGVQLPKGYGALRREIEGREYVVFRS